MNKDDLLKNWVINGVLTIQDGNFLGKEFSVTKIEDTGLMIGSYPAELKDISKLKDMGVKAIINVQTEAEIALRDIDIKKIQNYCLQNKIQFVRYPLKDTEDAEYAYDLFRISQKIS